MIKINALILFLAFGIPLSAGQDEGRGTVIVLAFAQDRIVMAADSRKSAYSGGRYSDDGCKLIPSDNFSVFAASGSVAFGGQLMTNWDGNDEATKIMARIKEPKFSPKYLRAAATNWAESITRTINLDLAADRVRTMQASEANTFLIGLFAGFDKGIAVLYQEVIRFDPAKQGATNTLSEAPISPVLQWGAMGYAEVADEVLKGESNLAKAERQKWKRLQTSIKFEDRDAYWAIQVINTSMANDPHRQEIGGPIDALEITAKGIRWIKRKSFCK